MATVGNQLIVPESGWNRYDNLNADPNTNNAFLYSGDNTYIVFNDFYNHGAQLMNYNASVTFWFTGTSLRIIAAQGNSYSQNITVSIDNIVETTTSYNASYQPQTLIYEKIGLDNKQHKVVITNKDTIQPLYFDAIDIIGLLDNLNPVITLNGTTPMILEVNSVFTDPGATAIDPNDGNLTASIMRTGIVDNNTIGSYTLSYQVTNSLGFTSTVTRKIYIIPHAPFLTVNEDDITTVISKTLTGSDTSSIQYYKNGILYLTSKIVTADTTFNHLTNVPIGTYTAYHIYNGQKSNVSNSVTVVADVTKPVIVLNGKSTIHVDQFTTYNDAGAIATDNRDGDITSKIITTNNVNTNIAGSYTVIYNVSDAAGNKADTVTRTVIVDDKKPPTITLLGDAIINIEKGTNFIDPGATAYDDVDGDLSSHIIVSGMVNIYSSGVYTLTYNVSDAAGNLAVPVTRTVNVKEPYIVSVNPIDTIQTNMGNQPFLPSIVKAVYSDNSIKDVMVTWNISNLNINAVGVYSLLGDIEGSTIQAHVNVIVVSPPVITLVGSSAMELSQWDLFTDPGAIAMDYKDGDITKNMIITGHVDTSTPGTYTLIYNVTNSVGEHALPVSRTVVVSKRTDIQITGNVPVSVTRIVNSNFANMDEDYYIHYIPTLLQFNVTINVNTPLLKSLPMEEDTSTIQIVIPYANTLTELEAIHAAIFLNDGTKWNMLNTIRDAAKKTLSASTSISGTIVVFVNDFWYSEYTQEIANEYPIWTHIRQTNRSNGQRFLNWMGMTIEQMHQEGLEIQQEKFIDLADTKMLDWIYMYELPPVTQTDSLVLYNGTNPIPILNTLKEFFYNQHDGGGMIDYDNHRFYSRIEYQNFNGAVNNQSFSSQSLPQSVWNTFDEFGLLFGVTRLFRESNEDFKERIKDVFRYPANSGERGLTNGIARGMNLIKRVTWKDDSKNLYIKGINIDPKSILLDCKPLEPNEYVIDDFQNIMIYALNYGREHTVSFIQYIEKHELNSKNDEDLYRMMYEDDGQASPSLQKWVSYINQVAPVMWGSFNWDQGYWDTIDQKATGLGYIPNIWDSSIDAWKNYIFDPKRWEGKKIWES